MNTQPSRATSRVEGVVDVGGLLGAGIALLTIGIRDDAPTLSTAAEAVGATPDGGIAARCRQTSRSSRSC